MRDLLKSTNRKKILFKTLELLGIFIWNAIMIGGFVYVFFIWKGEQPTSVERWQKEVERCERLVEFTSAMIQNTSLELEGLEVEWKKLINELLYVKRISPEKAQVMAAKFIEAQRDFLLIQLKMWSEKYQEALEALEYAREMLERAKVRETIKEEGSPD